MGGGAARQKKTKCRAECQQSAHTIHLRYGFGALYDTAAVPMPSVAEGGAHHGGGAVEISEGFDGFCGGFKEDRAGFSVFVEGKVVCVGGVFRAAEIVEQDGAGKILFVGAVHGCHGDQILGLARKLFAATSSAVDVIEAYRAGMDLIFDFQSGVPPGEEHQHPHKQREEGDHHHDGDNRREENKIDKSKEKVKADQ